MREPISLHEVLKPTLTCFGGYEFPSLGFANQNSSILLYQLLQVLEAISAVLVRLFLSLTCSTLKTLKDFNYKTIYE